MQNVVYFQLYLSLYKTQKRHFDKKIKADKGHVTQTRSGVNRLTSSICGLFIQLFKCYAHTFIDEVDILKSLICNSKVRKWSIASDKT